jgi:hypothetical protein
LKAVPLGWGAGEQDPLVIVELAARTTSKLQASRENQIGNTVAGKLNARTDKVTVLSDITKHKEQFKLKL